MTQPTGGLGRGLSALLPKQEERNVPTPGSPVLRDIPIESIRPNARQPRGSFNEEALNELAESIRAVGLLQPIIVREDASGGFELIAGERRLRASKLAGADRIAAIVKTAADDQMLRDALIENLQRVDLDPLEEAAGYRQLIDDLGATHEDIARRVGKSRAAITNALRLMTLAPEVQERISSGALSAAHGRALAGLPDADAQVRAARRIVAEQLSVRATEDLVRTMSTQITVATHTRTPAPAQSDRPAGILQAEVMLSDILGTSVSVETRRRRGRIIIEFADFEDLDRLVRIVSSPPEHAE